LFVVFPDESIDLQTRLEIWRDTFREHNIPVVVLAFSEGVDLEKFKGLVDETAAASPETPLLFQKALMTAYNSALQNMRAAH